MIVRFEAVEFILRLFLSFMLAFWGANFDSTLTENVMKKLLIIALTMLSIGLRAQTWENYVRITGVHDGDGSFYGIDDQGDKVQLRLRNVDCPEIYSRYVLKNQPFGLEAAANVRDLIKGKKVYAVCFGKSFKREVCDITYYEDSLLTNPKDLRTTILKSGWGWFDGNNYGMKIPDDSKFTGGRKLMNVARNEGIGLWELPNPVKPAQWRQMYKPNK